MCDKYDRHNFTIITVKECTSGGVKPGVSSNVILSPFLFFPFLGEW